MASLIVHEPSPYWGPILQREFDADHELQVRSAPHPLDLAEKSSAQDTMACLIVFHSQSSPDLVRQIAQLSQQLPVIVVAQRLLPSVEWQLREAGAVSILESPIPVSQLVRTLRRRLQSNSATTRIGSAKES